MTPHRAAPAINNAIYDAIGVHLDSVPFTPEKILRALGKLGYHAEAREGLPRELHLRLGMGAVGHRRGAVDERPGRQHRLDLGHPHHRLPEARAQGPLLTLTAAQAHEVGMEACGVCHAPSEGRHEPSQSKE